MKKMTIYMICIVLLMFSLTACGSAETSANGTSEGEESSPADTQKAESAAKTEEAKTSDATENTEDTASLKTTEVTEPSSKAETETDAPASDVLVVYFSATGTTKKVAEKIAAVTGGDLYEIKAAVEYTDADLDWNDTGSRSTKEQNDSLVRPEIGSEPVVLDGYSTVYMGYPIWWGEEPRIMDTFVESCSFDGITVIPFCTSGGSGIGRSGKNLEEKAGSGNWLEGKRFSSGVSEEEISSWIDGLK